MSSVVIFRPRQIMIAMCIMAAFLGNASAAPKTITVEGQTGRPVAEAVLELEKRYGWVITYEDPPYVHYSDIVDVTDTDGPEVLIRSQAELQAMGDTRTLGPKTDSLTFTPPSADDPDEMAAVEALLKSYNEGHHGFEFAVVRGAGLLHVIPRQARGLSGNLEPVKPVLDTVITIEPKERTSEALLEEVFKKVFIATNTRIMIGTVSLNLLIRSKTAIGGSERTARSILEQWFLGSGLSWLLLYGPDDKDYFFNIDQPTPNKGLISRPRPSPGGKP